MLLGAGWLQRPSKVGDNVTYRVVRFHGSGALLIEAQSGDRRTGRSVVSRKLDNSQEAVGMAENVERKRGTDSSGAPPRAQLMVARLYP